MLREKDAEAERRLQQDLQKAREQRGQINQASSNTNDGEAGYSRAPFQPNIRVSEYDADSSNSGSTTSAKTSVATVTDPAGKSNGNSSSSSSGGSSSTHRPMGSNANTTSAQSKSASSTSTANYQENNYSVMYPGTLSKTQDGRRPSKQHKDLNSFLREASLASVTKSGFSDGYLGIPTADGDSYANGSANNGSTFTSSAYSSISRGISKTTSVLKDGSSRVAEMTVNTFHKVVGSAKSSIGVGGGESEGEHSSNLSTNFKESMLNPNSAIPRASVIHSNFQGLESDTEAENGSGVSGTSASLHGKSSGNSFALHQTPMFDDNFGKSSDSNSSDTSFSSRVSQTAVSALQTSGAVLRSSFSTIRSKLPSVRGSCPYRCGTNRGGSGRPAVNVDLEAGNQEMLNRDSDAFKVDGGAFKV
jgi:trimeric autotransporter adhesin